MIEDEVINQYVKKEEIKEIINIIKNKRIIKTDHFYFRIHQRNIDEEFVNRIMLKFERVKLIDKRLHKKGDVGYDFYYELDNSRTLKLCFIVEGNKVLLVNAILRLRIWQSNIKILGGR